MNDFQNYESKYPRLPTLSELGNLFNTNNLRTKSFDFNKSLGIKKIKNSDNENLSGYNETLFLKKIHNKDITNNNKKIIFNSNFSKNDNEEKNQNVNTQCINNSYRPKINKKYHFNNRF